MKNTFAFVSLLFALLAGLTFSTNASAQTIRGFISEKADGSLALRFSMTEPAYTIEASRVQVSKEIRNLKVGDYLVARGTLDVEAEIATIDTIETVGLQELIGPWQSPGSRIYEFENFTRLNLYVAQRDPRGVVLSKLKEMNYSVAPENQTGRYSIFMSDNRSVQVGFLHFDSEGVELTVIDPKTGRVSEHIELSPIPVVQ